MGAGVFSDWGHLRCRHVHCLSTSPATTLQVLRRTRGSIELVDAAKLLPGLKRTPGLHSWRPFGKQKQTFCSTGDEARAVGTTSCLLEVARWTR